MKFAIPFVCLAFLFLDIDAARISRQIMGGESADISDFPYQVSLRFQGAHGCGGAIIGKRHILTAAHCIRGNFVPPFGQCTVNAGTSSSSLRGSSYRIAGVTIHPEWTQRNANFHLINDIAVLKLMDDIHINPYQKIIRVATRDVISRTQAIVSGWGCTTNTSGDISEQLHQLKMILLSKADCHLRYRFPELVNVYDKQICAIQKRGHETCIGDSGSPLVVGNQVVGIVSFDVRVSATETVDLVTNVYAYRDFIQNALSR